MSFSYDISDIQAHRLTSISPDHSLPKTIFIKFKTDTASQIQYMFVIGNPSSVNEMWISAWFDNKFMGVAYTGASSNVFTTTAISLGVWHTGVARFTDSTTRTVWLDGGGRGDSSASSSGPTNTSVIAIGRAARGAAQSFGGEIACVFVWNAALTDAEVAALSAGKWPMSVRPGSLLYAYTQLSADSGNWLNRMGGVTLLPEGSVGTPTKSEVQPLRNTFQQGMG